MEKRSSCNHSAEKIHSVLSFYILDPSFQNTALHLLIYLPLSWHKLSLTEITAEDQAAGALTAKITYAAVLVRENSDAAP